MRSYCAVYVDAGYLLASAATLVAGTSLRGAVRVDHGALIEAMIAQVEEHAGMPLLRVNWSDSAPPGVPDPVQDGIGMLPRVKLRLGRISPAGEQKGVDLRIGLDLAAHGRNNAVDVMYLVSGDDDLTEAVEEAQSHGAQVIVLAVPTPAGRPYSVARHLQREADQVVLLDPATIASTVTAATVTSPPPAPSSATGAVVTPADPAQRAELLAAGSRYAYIPPELDRALLTDLSNRTGTYEIPEPTKRRLRARFWELLPTLLAPERGWPPD